MKSIFILISILFTMESKSKTITICDSFPEYCTNLKRNQSRSSNSAAPTQSSAVFSNPAAVSTDKGLGIETINYKGDSQLSIVTGSGRVGAAISNNPSDETFFGNIGVEDQGSFRRRKLLKDKFQIEKFAFSGSVTISGKKKKKGLQVNIGGTYRNVPSIKAEYAGGGISINYSRIFSFGYSEYQDASAIDYRGETVKSVNADGSHYDLYYPDLNENLLKYFYRVQNYVAGFNYGNYSFDYAWFTTTHEEDNRKTYLKIFTASYFYKRWMFTYGSREEESSRELYDTKQKAFSEEKFKYASFLGIQYAIGNHFVAGLFNNYYLLNEWSAGLTFFF